MTAEPTTEVVRPRRQVLCGLMVALLAPAALAACSTETPAPAPPGGSTPGGSTPGGSPAGGALAAVADIPEGSGLIVDGPDTQILLVRSSGDSVKAFNPACTHQGTTVAPPEGGVITCPSHGSTFDGATGALKGGPATSGLTEIPVKVEGGNVLLA